MFRCLKAVKVENCTEGYPILDHSRPQTRKSPWFNEKLGGQGEYSYNVVSMNGFPSHLAASGVLLLTCG